MVQFKNCFYCKKEFKPSRNDVRIKYCSGKCSSHFHIELNIEEAKVLRDWINKYVNYTEE